MHSFYYLVSAEWKRNKPQMFLQEIESVLLITTTKDKVLHFYGVRGDFCISLFHNKVQTPHIL